MRTSLSVTVAALLAAGAAATPPDGPPREMPVWNQPPMPPPPPTAEDVLQAINANAARAESLQADVVLDVMANGRAFGLEGKLAWKRGAGVRLVCTLAGQPVLDVGQGRSGAWLWRPKSGAASFVGGGRERNWTEWPAPVPPFWLPEVLGLGSKGARAAKVEQRGPDYAVGFPYALMRDAPRCRFVLVRSLSPLAVTEHRIETADGQLLLRAVINKTSQEPNGLVLPRHLELSWPEQKLTARLRLERIRVNPEWDEEQVARLFSPPPEVREKVEVAAAVEVVVRPDGYEVRRGNETLKLAGAADELSLRLLQDQLRQWAPADGRVNVRCAQADYAAVKAVLDACRAAGARQIEVCRDKL
jgi:hypothetical protein